MNIDEVRNRTKQTKRTKRRVDCVLSLDPSLELVKASGNKYYVKQGYAVRAGPVFKFEDESIVEALMRGEAVPVTIYVNQQVRLSYTKKAQVLSTVCSSTRMSENQVLAYKPEPADDDVVTVISVREPRFADENDAPHYVIKPYRSKFTSHKTVINAPQNPDAVKVGYNATPSGGHVVDYYLEPLD